jgi:transposase InsO family protein
VVVDTLTKSAHFIPVRTTYQAPDIARVFISESVRLHGVPNKIISDQGSVFTGRFWTSFQEALGTQLNFSTAYHLETDGQTERMNQTLEDMLRMSVMDQQKHGEGSLPLVEFAYNNSYQSTIKMAPFEFLYGRPCQTPLSWDRLEDRVLVGPEVIQEIEEQVQTIIQRINEAQDRQRVMPMRTESTVVTRSAIESSYGLNRIRIRSSWKRELNSLLGSWDLSRLWRERGSWPID